MSQIILKVDNIFVDVLGELPSNIKNELEKKLSFRPKNFQFSSAYNTLIRNEEGKVVRRLWDGWKHQFWSGKKRTYFPTGLYSLASDYLKSKHISFISKDMRVRPDKNFDIIGADDFVPRDYQNKATYDACNASRGIIQAATGAGKTVIAAGIIKELRVSPFMFFVTSIDLLTQAKESFENFLRFNGSNLKVGQIGGGTIDIQDVNVCTIQTAVRALGGNWDSKLKFDSEDQDDKTPIETHRHDIIDLIRSSKGSICDEVQHWRADTCQLVARELKSAYYTYGMSATPYRDEGDDMLIQACFGKKVAAITATELIEQGWLIRPEIKIVHVKNRRTKFKQWQSIYKDRVVECDTYNGMVSNIANAYIDEGRLVLVLVQHINHGKKLASMIKGATFLSGNSSKKKREEGLNNLKNHYVRCIVSSTIFDEGIDVKPLNCVLLAGQGQSRTRAMQRIGRITRPYTSPTGEVKQSATAIDFCIHDKYLQDHSHEREKMYRTESAYKIEHINE